MNWIWFKKGSSFFFSFSSEFDCGGAEITLRWEIVRRRRKIVGHLIVVGLDDDCLGVYAFKVDKDVEAGSDRKR